MGAENMFQPDPVVFLGIERVCGRLVRDFAQQKNIDLVLTEQDLGGLVAQSSQVPGRFAGLALLAKPVARTLEGKIGGEDLPPEVSPRIEAHGLEARIGQAVKPMVELGENRPHHPVEGLRGPRCRRCRRRSLCHKKRAVSRRVARCPR